MIAVLLLGALLVLGLLALGVYLLFFRSDPPPEAEVSPPGASAPPSPGAPGTNPDSGGDSGGGSGSGSSTAPAPGGGRPGDLETAARDYVDAVNDRDEAAATALTCERANPGTLFSVTGGREVRLDRVEVLEGAVGTAQLRVGDGETALLLEKQEDGWCVAI